MKLQYIKWFKEITIEDVPEVGGKNASLGEMYQNLTSQGVLITNGFAVTASAHADVLDFNKSWIIFILLRNTFLKPTLPF